jgi:hypothetical protein
LSTGEMKERLTSMAEVRPLKSGVERKDCHREITLLPVAIRRLSIQHRAQLAQPQFCQREWRLNRAGRHELDRLMQSDGVSQSDQFTFVGRVYDGHIRKDDARDTLSITQNMQALGHGLISS